MLYVSFISAPGCLAVAVGLVTPLRPCPDYHVALFKRPFRVLRPYTDRPPMQGLPRPNCHSHWFTSYTLLPLLPFTAAASAAPNWNALPVRCRNLCSMVGDWE